MQGAAPENQPAMNQLEGALDDAPEKVDPFAVYRKRAGMRCPHCRHVATRRTSIPITPLVWDHYYACSHLLCGHTWKAQLSYTYGLVPSAAPDPDLDHLPMCPINRAEVVKPDPPPAQDPNQLKLFS